jgi:TetR/AcrR family transcriptional repressor of nem operon
MGRTSDAKQRLIAAMADLVHRRGYTSVTVDDVCAAAQVKKGSFYYFFPSKRDLMLAALDRKWEMGRDHFLSAAFADDLPPLQRIQRFFTMIADIEASNKKRTGQVLGCPFGNVAAETSTTEPVLAKRADAAFCGMADFIRDCLQRAIAAGELPRSTDVKGASEAIVAYFEGLSVMAKARNDPSVYRRLSHRAVLLAANVQDKTPTAGGTPRRRKVAK